MNDTISSIEVPENFAGKLLFKLPLGIFPKSFILPSFTSSPLEQLSTFKHILDSFKLNIRVFRLV